MSFFSSPKENVHLLIDIGSGSMTISLVLYKEKELPVFLCTLKNNFIIADRPDSSKLFENMTKVLDELLLDLMKKGFEHKYFKGKQKDLAHVSVSFSSPWFLPKTKHVEIKREKPFTISEQFIHELLSKEEGSFEEEIKKMEDNGDTFDVIEKSIVHIKVNGYTLSQTLGQKANNFDAYICMSVVSKSVIDKVHTIIYKHTHLPQEKISSHTFPIVSFTVLRDLFANYQDFLLIDVTSEVTDVTLVQNDIVIETASFPSGRNFIIRQIAKEFAVSVEIAESKLKLYSLGKLDEETTKKLQVVFENVEKEWSVYFENAAIEISTGVSLPNRVYITMSEDVAELYTLFLKTPKADATSNFRKNINLLHVDNTILTPLFKNDSLTKPDEFISMLAIFYNKISQKNKGK